MNARARAQSTVELAVIFPLLTLVATGLLQFAIYYHARNVVVAAVQEGAQVAAALDGSEPAGAARADAVLRAGLGEAARQHIRLLRAERGDERVRMEAEGYMQMFVGRLPLNVTADVSRERFRGPP